MAAVCRCLCELPSGHTFCTSQKLLVEFHNIFWFTAPITGCFSPFCSCADDCSCLNTKLVPTDFFLLYFFFFGSTSPLKNVLLFKKLVFIFQWVCSSLLLHVRCKFYKSVLWPSVVTNRTCPCRNLKLLQLSQELFARSDLLTPQPLLPSLSVCVWWQFSTFHPNKLI